MLEKKISFNGLQKYPLVAAMITQVFTLFFLRNLFWFTHTNVSIPIFVFLQILISALICHYVLRLPKWFVAISILLPLCIAVSWMYLHLSASFYGVAFIILALTFSHTLSERVPLYLSNNITSAALKKMAIEHQAKNFLDLGSGLGGVVRALSSDGIKSHGVESAPMLWIISSFISVIQNRGRIHRQNIWNTDFSEYDMIYAFLSPAIMEKLYEKVKKEMRPNTIFISNSFAVLGIEASLVWVLEDKRETKLYIYKN